MSKPKPVFNKLYLLLFTFVTLMVIITNSCKKNNSIKEAPSDVHGLQIDLDALKADYASDTLLKQKVAGNNQSTAADLIKNTGIKWDAIYYRERNDSRILEFDVAKGTKNIIPGFLGGVSHSNYHDKTSLVFLQFNNGTNMRFFMKVVETGEDATGQIIQGLHYSFIPDSFTGYIFYYTTGKQIMGGYTYTNGKITGTYTSATTGGTKTQAVNTIKNHTMEGTCTNWYWGNDEEGWEYLGTTCDVRDGDGGDGRAPGDSGGGGGVDPCAVPPTGPPKPPKPPTGPPTVNENIKVVGGHATIMAISGCPPPGSSNLTINIDSLFKHFPCAVALIINNLGECGTYSELVQPFMSDGMGQPNLTWTNGPLTWNQTDPNGGISNSLGETSTIGNTYSATITLNTNMLQNSSKLLIASAAIHETLHAVINYKLKIAGYNVADGNVTLGSWLFGIDSW